MQVKCPIVEGKELMRLRFTDKQRIAALTRAKLQSPQSRALACFRGGVEGIPSVLRRTWGVDRLPIRGLLRSKMWIGLKCRPTIFVRHSSTILRWPYLVFWFFIFLHFSVIRRSGPYMDDGIIGFLGANP
ncbi:hypothetical protein IC619_014530 [Hazenella sp. IB182353]|nr:hypothetical protein [Polycladospora coralii]